ncbi:MAG: TetR/AcrR family transcriptional regulator [bacterium]|nr:TetR/AcrR family transcriptional regulator [bacterium]
MPKIVDHAAQRAAILDQSFELFARQGYAALTMRKIAGELKISTGTLYHYFPTKENIFEEMFGHMSRAVVADAVAVLAANAEREDRQAVLMEYVQANETRLQNMLFLILDFYRHQNPDDATDYSRQIVGFFRQMISEQLGYDDPDRAAATFSMILGILFHRLLDPGHDFERLMKF